jgi:16S rRNA (cytosine967-C5)-methyltransferase
LIARPAAGIQMSSPARAVAYDALRSVNSGRSDLPSALARARAVVSDERDQALVAEITTGTLRWQGALDHLIEHFSGRPVSRIDDEVLDALRLGAYQLVHLDRVPASAAVDESVKLVKRARKRSAAGFANAVLRGIARGRSGLPLPDRSSPLDYLAVTWSHPRWLAARWLNRLGLDAAEAWVRFNNSPAPLTLRANRLKIAPEALAERLQAAGVGVEPARYAPDALIVTSGNPLATPLAGSGLFIVQEEASQLVGLLTRVAAGERVLDACASPGGKTTAMAAAAGSNGLVVATDLRARRLRLLRDVVSRMGADRVRLARMDAAMPLPLRPVFDCVLLDAPCSGLGTIRRDPEVRWRRQESELERMSLAQRAMIERCAEVALPRGRLVYATCSSEPEENELVVEWFLERNRGWVLADAREEPGGLHPGLEAVVDQHGYLRSTPHQHGLEAFFAAVLRRRAV